MSSSSTVSQSPGSWPFWGLLGATATALMAGWLWCRKECADDEEDEDTLIIYTSAGEQQHQTGPAEVSKHLRTKSNGVKFSRLRRMLEDLAGASDPSFAGDPLSQPSAVVVNGTDNEGATEKEATPLEPFNELTWEEQILRERTVLESAARLLRDVRQSSVHRKLPHFHAVDRQLQVLETALEGVAVMVRGFWRYGRDQPMAELMDLPLLRLAGTDIEQAGPLIPLSVGVVREESKGRSSDNSNDKSNNDINDGDENNDDSGILDEAEDEEGAEGREKGRSAEERAMEDLALLGLVAGDREAIESAYRRRSRHFHRHGRCTNIRGFHALTAARNRCVARLMGPSIPAYGLCGGDLLALYLLIGTDPIDNRYGERSLGILDATHRSQLQTKLQVLHWPSWDIPLTWGDEDDMITFGGPNHMGSSG